MYKKFLPLISVLLIAAFVLAACGGTPAAETQAPAEPTTAVVQPTTAVVEPTAAVEQPTAAPAETQATTGEAVTITIWHQWDGKYLDAITQAFKDYETQHPNVKIDLSKPEDVSNSLNVAIPAGEGPDIIGWANDKIGVQALAGNIVALNDYGIDQSYLEGIYTPAAVAGVSWQDKIWALPETMEGIALVANTDVVTDEYIPTDPANFQDLLDKATAFQKANPDKVLVCNQGFGAEDAYHVAPIFFGFGVPSFVDEEGNAYMNTPEALKAGQWLADMSKVSLKENSYDICNAALAEGKVGMWWTGPWAIAGLESSGVKYKIVPMGKPFVGIKTVMLTQNAVDRGHAEAALDVMKYYTSAEVQKKLALVNKTIPAQTAALDDPEVSALPAVAGFGQAIASGVPMSPSPFSDAQWTPVGRAAAAIWTGAQDPQTALNDAQKAIEEAVAGMK